MGRHCHSEAQGNFSQSLQTSTAKTRLSPTYPICMNDNILPPSTAAKTSCVFVVAPHSQQWGLLSLFNIFPLGLHCSSLPQPCCYTTRTPTTAAFLKGLSQSAHPSSYPIFPQPRGNPTL